MSSRISEYSGTIVHHLGNTCYSLSDLGLIKLRELIDRQYDTDNM